MNTADFKGIALYLIISGLLIFVGTFVLVGEEALVFQSPNLFQYIAQLGLMVVPAFAALAAGLFSKADIPRPTRGLEWPTLRAALRVTLMSVFLFAVAYAVATLFGFTYPQWNLAGLLNEVEAVSLQPLSEDVKAMAPAILLVSYPLVSILMGATLFTAVAIASEIGWRGFLLPRLLFLGVWPAHILGGILWGLWFFPLIYAWHRETGDFSGLAEVQLRFVALGVALSAVVGPIHQRTGSLVLCGLALGAFVGQACGIWGQLFQQTASPWTGPIGWLVIVVVAVSAVFPGCWSTPREERDT